MKKLIILLILVAVVLFSGCQQKGAGNPADKAPEKNRFLSANKEAYCLNVKAKKSEDPSLEQKTKEIYINYGFDLDDSQSMQNLLDNYGEDAEFKTMVESALKECGTNEDIEALKNAPLRARDAARISNLSSIQQVLVKINLEGKPYPRKSGVISDDLDYSGYGGSNTWAELKPHFGKSPHELPKDPSTDKDYYFVSNPTSNHEAGVFALVEVAPNANARCTTGESPTITFGAPEGNFDPTQWCYAVLMELAETPTKTTTVEDYYYSLPSKYLGMGIGDSKTERENAIASLDLKNDYIEIRTPSWDGGGDMAIFRTTRGDDLIAVSNTSCGPLCIQNFYLLRYKSGRWTDVTAEVMPSIDEDAAKEKLAAHLKETGAGNVNKEGLDFAPMIEIPQFGTTMNYFDQYSNTVIYEIKWRKGSFYLN
ncbi:hypothetical protein CO046_02635 [Candidatus Peregrinibacteria bacterium CG_4_9_14_0_2_um_filter_53_11]|nr:MAG: hypothetical protein CO046_02635 [Candidatus Peregrinibacteria bacterium CG_4_9_14_0_2_um_filter_53_11]